MDYLKTRMEKPNEYEEGYLTYRSGVVDGKHGMTSKAHFVHEDLRKFYTQGYRDGEKESLKQDATLSDAHD